VVNLQLSPTGFGFDSGYVYFSGTSLFDGGPIWQAKKPATHEWSSGWNLEVKKVQDTWTEGEFVIRDGNVYYRADAPADALTHTLYRVPVAGGTPVPLMAHRSTLAFAVDADGIYVSDATGVRSIPLAGCPR
jgi:hypothetical protein